MRYQCLEVLPLYESFVHVLAFVLLYFVFVLHVIFLINESFIVAGFYVLFV